MDRYERAYKHSFIDTLVRFHLEGQINPDTRERKEKGKRRSDTAQTQPEKKTEG